MRMQLQGTQERTSISQGENSRALLVAHESWKAAQYSQASVCVQRGPPASLLCG